MITNAANAPSAARTPTAGDKATGATPATTMRAAVQRRYASPEHIAIEDVPVPRPGEGEVLIEVRAAGVDRGVWHLATGRPLVMRILGFGLRRPAQPVQGSDVAGVVAALGTGVTRFQVGDEVYGSANGAYAEFAVARADRLDVKPRTATFTQAAAMPVSGVTALQALTEAAAVRAGQRVLVLGGSGGVGSFAIQIAAAAGAHVTGVSSTAKTDLVQELGASAIIDYRTTDVTQSGDTFDLIIDTGGLTPLRRLRRILSPTGTVVIVGGEGGGTVLGGVGRNLASPLVTLGSSQRMVGLMSSTTADRLARLRELVDAGAVRAPVGRTYPLETAADAVADLASGSIPGKAVVTVRGVASAD